MTGLTLLSLSDTPITDLTPIAALIGLTWLSLNNTRITDLTPITAPTGLATLDIVGCPVLDLRPLTSLGMLVSNPVMSGLSFNDTAATRADPRIADIADIEDPATRARELFAYLENWLPPVPADLPLVPSFRVPEEGPITSGEDPPEDGDEDQEDLRQDLMRKASLLIEAIGNSNEMAVLKGAAEHYQRQINKPLARIKVSLLYSAANSLRVCYEADLRAEQLARFNDMLPPGVAAPLKDLVETHALFFMGFPNAAAIHQTMLAGLTGDRNRAQVALATQNVQAFEGKPQVLDTEDQQALADDLAGAKGEGPSAEIAERRLVARLWNIFGAVGRRAYSASKAGGVIVISYDIPAFILGQQTLIGSFLKATQGAGAAWFDILAHFLMRL